MIRLGDGGTVLSELSPLTIFVCALATIHNDCNRCQAVPWRRASTARPKANGDHGAQRQAGQRLCAGSGGRVSPKPEETQADWRRLARGAVKPSSSASHISSTNS